jgi:uncharacterized protein YcbK (DUF882 family)
MSNEANILQEIQGKAEISRRAFIQKASLMTASALIAPSFISPSLFGGTLSHDNFEKRLKLHNRHTGENLDVVFCRGKNYCVEGLAQIDHLMRDHRRNIKVPIDLKLIEGIHKLSLLIGRHLPIEIVCGFRTYFTNEMLRQTNRRVAEESYHMKGKAVDIRVHGVQPLHIQRAAKILKMGGVGYYPKAKFVHLDTGPIRFW